jgi:hypothetical protein
VLVPEDTVQFISREQLQAARQKATNQRNKEAITRIITWMGSSTQVAVDVLEEYHKVALRSVGFNI